MALYTEENVNQHKPIPAPSKREQSMFGLCTEALLTCSHSTMNASRWTICLSILNVESLIDLIAESPGWVSIGCCISRSSSSCCACTHSLVVAVRCSVGALALSGRREISAAGLQIRTTTDTARCSIMRLARDWSQFGDVRRFTGVTDAKDGRFPFVSFGCKLLELGGFAGNSAGKFDIFEDGIVLGNGHVHCRVISSRPAVISRGVYLWCLKPCPELLPSSPSSSSGSQSHTLCKYW